MKKLMFLSLIAFFFLPSSRSTENEDSDIGVANQVTSEQQRTESTYDYALKTAAYWTSPIMSRTEAKNLAKHDLLIVDLENKFNNRNTLLEIKALNPRVKILAYSNPMEIFLTLYDNRKWQNAVINEITKNRKEWLLKTISHTGSVKQENYARFWPGMTMLNMSSDCPKINGETYSEWMAEKIRTEIISDPIFDGYFMDNGTVNISWVHPSDNEKFDIDGDRRAESDVYVDRKWAQGVNDYLAYIRLYGQNKKGFWTWLKGLFNYKSDIIIISNKGDLNLLKLVDGKFFEKFPNNYLGDTWANGWRQSISNAEKTGAYTILQVDRGDLEFGLASALLLDNSYLALGQDDSGVFPQFNLNTGRPLGKMRRDGYTYSREYEKIKVTVNPLQRKGEIVHK